MRFRTLSDSHYEYGSSRYVLDPSGTWSSWSFPLTQREVYLRHQEMADVIDDREHFVHPVDHRKFLFLPNIGEVAEAYDASSPWYKEQYLPPFKAYYPFNAGDSSWLPLPSSGVQGKLADDAFTALSEQVPQEVDLFNFLLDFREISGLIPKIEESMLKTVSGGFLSYSFGWAPMISDLKKLGHLSVSVANRLKWLRDTRGKHVRIGFSAAFQVEGHAQDLPSFTHGPWTLTPVSSSGQFRAGGTLYHELDRLEGIEGQLRAFASALGLLAPSRVVWERIPFSFVADWFARTKSISDSVVFQPYPGTWQITDVSHSFKQRSETLVRGTSFSLTPLSGVWGTLVCERYSRGSGLPVSASIFDGELTTGQLVLAAALIGAATR